MTYHRRIADQTELENSLMVTVAMLSRDGAETSSPAVLWEDPPAGPALTFSVPRGSGGELLLDHGVGNKLLFGTMVSYRVVGPDRELRRYADPLVPTPLAPHPLQLSPLRDAAYFGDPARPYKVLARGAVEFSAVGRAVDGYTGAESKTGANLALARIIRLHVKLNREYQSRNYAVSMGLDIVPRN